MTRAELLERIGRAASFGHLGFFVGSGFSLAVCDHAPNFEELLRRIDDDLGIGVNFDDPAQVRGRSFPQLASHLVSRYRTAHAPMTQEKAVDDFKRATATLCDLHPRENLRAEYRTAFAELRPSWVITTNYDFVLETLIDNGVWLLPNEVLAPRNDYVPIYHLHGHRRQHGSIVITEEDYVDLLGPVEYRQLKLALLLAESSTVMLGYSLGDINVRSAREWSQAFAGDARRKRLHQEPYQGLLVQALYVRAEDRPPAPEPYVGPDGQWVVEIQDIRALLLEMRIACQQVRAAVHQLGLDLDAWLNDPNNAQQFRHTAAVRQRFVALAIQSAKLGWTHRLIQFLRDVLGPIWSDARQDGGFGFYETFLAVLLDLVVNIEMQEMHPATLAYLAEQLASVAHYIDPRGLHQVGMAWGATDLWAARRAEIPGPMKDELRSYANRHGSNPLAGLLA